jgi:hypothetical protein
VLRRTNSCWLGVPSLVSLIDPLPTGTLSGPCI